MAKKDGGKRPSTDTFSYRGSENLNVPKRPANATGGSKSTSKPESGDTPKGEKAEKK